MNRGHVTESDWSQSDWSQADGSLPTCQTALGCGSHCAGHAVQPASLGLPCIVGDLLSHAVLGDARVSTNTAV